MAKFSTLALAVAATITAGSASAVTLDYDFTGNGETASSHSFVSNGVTLDVSAKTFYGSFGVDAKVTKWSQGIGISSLTDWDHEIDGSLGNDFAVLSFSEEIESLATVTFSYVDSNDAFSLYKFDGVDFSFLTTDKIATSATGYTIATYTFDENYGGNTFYLGAKDSKDNFKLRGLTATTADVSAIPLPAGAVLLLSGLAGLGVARRKNKAA